MSRGVKINTGGMVDKTQSLMDELDRMAATTTKLHGTASGYNDRIHDGLMSEMVETLEQIRSEIEAIKKKTYEFTKDKNEGAKELDATLRRGKTQSKRV